ncbi:putative solute-binding protein family 3/ domain of MltF [Helianthus annuus]|uniref:Ionotropic glutamate receptor, metazoa n=1 Tax=Helianthus annuus TaxID=4232 RepID=A0A251TLG0_HELAN|nr:putative ionotropic glutamate receptor, metazoa [Helianthus annuus]KAJ0514487.1 putative solute-binding protein family 3/ domain of MltF [Helianthus annuus]KAJ0744357.1 putative solute-binding protein family 3/ domain of MltF [Helianthus annuus]
MSCTKKQFHSILYSKKSLSDFSIIMVSQPTNNSAANETNGASNYTHLIDNVGEILWPVQPWYASRSSRRNLAGSSKKRMKVLFPAHSLFRQFVSVDCDPEFHAVAGDVTITSKRHEHAHFTQPFTESGLEMIVPARSRLSNQPWLFLKPFTVKMWWITVAITLYNGFVIWFIERNHNKDLQGNIITQIGIILWLAFSTLFTLRGDKMHSNLSRMAVIVWLFVALIITQSYTASLVSMLTAQRLEPTITSFEMLRDMNAAIGYCNGSFINEYLVNVLKFKNFSIKSYNSTDGYAEGLNSGEIKAIFLEVPAAKVFLAQYCKSFIRTGETFKVGGFGFVSLLVSSFSLSQYTSTFKFKN